MRAELVSLAPFQRHSWTEVTLLSPEQTEHELTAAYLFHYGLTVAATNGSTESPRCVFLLPVFNPRSLPQKTG